MVPFALLVALAVGAAATTASWPPVGAGYGSFADTARSVAPGETLNVVFRNRRLAGQRIEIALQNYVPGDDHYPTPARARLDLALDGAGRGERSWTVPARGWRCVILSHATAPEPGFVHVTAPAELAQEPK